MSNFVEQYHPSMDCPADPTHDDIAKLEAEIERLRAGLSELLETRTYGHAGTRYYTVDQDELRERIRALVNSSPICTQENVHANHE